MTEQALRMSAICESIIHSSLDMIIAVDQERNIIEFNEAAQKNLWLYSEKCLENISACCMRKRTKRLRFISEPSMPSPVLLQEIEYPEKRRTLSLRAVGLNSAE